MTRVVSLLVMVLASQFARASDYRIESVIGVGDPRGSRVAGTQKLVSTPDLIVKSGEESEVLVGGHIQVGADMLPVGRHLEVVATKVDDGGVKVRAVFRVHTAVGVGAARQVTTVTEESVGTIQLGGTIRVQIGKDPKNLQWVDVTVRTMK